MYNCDLRPGERVDDLVIGGLKIIQHKEEFCFSLDAVLLAQFATVRPGASVVDLGTGTGVIGLLLLARGAGAVTGIELSASLADMAARSVLLNQLEDKMRVLNVDLRKLRGVLPSGASDLVVSNPPYRQVGGGFISPNERVARAHHELTASLDDVIAAARYLVKYRGRFAMVHLAERMTGILAALSAADIEPKRLRLVHSARGKKAKLLLVEGIRGARPGLEVLPPLIVYNADGSYAEEIQAYYR